MASSRGYVHAGTPYADELERLQLLEHRYDAQTIRRLRALGPLTAAACLEVGAGAGSIARFLAAEVGPAGRVIATDADPRFLDDLHQPNLTVRQHDILTDPLEQSAYDLVHCRALLLHLPDPTSALHRMAAALRPGGWLLIEDADYSSFAAADPAHPAAAGFDRTVRAALQAWAAGTSFDPYFGRRLPAHVDSLGLTERGDEAIALPRTGGSPEADLFARSVRRERPRGGRTGTFSDRDAHELLAALADPSFVFFDSLNVAAWGRSPLPASAYLG